MEDKDLSLESRIKENRRFYWSGILTGILFGLLICACLFLVIKIRELRNAGEIQVDATYEEANVKEVASDAVQEKIRVLAETINNYYMGDVTTEDLVNGLYYGMLDSLNDPYSQYYTVEELEALMQDTQGIYYGIGAVITLDTEKELCYIKQVIEDSPAEKAGLLEGDYFAGINGTSCVGMDATEVATTLRGEKGTSATITIHRPSTNETFDVSVTRDKVKQITVTSQMLEDNIGYIQITSFDDVTTDQFKEEYAALTAEKMQALIIDIRSNPGGNVTTVCDVSKMLLPKGLIFYTEEKDGTRTEYECDGENEIQIPLVVLVDGHSASASEILAGAVKDYKKGTLVGTTTFGKGIVQRLLSISDGTAIKLTIAKYFTPNGNYIHGTGIEPDVYIEFDSEAYTNDGYDNQLEKGIEILKQELGIE